MERARLCRDRGRAVRIGRRGRREDIPHIDRVPFAGPEFEIRPPAEQHFCASGHGAIRGRDDSTRNGLDRSVDAHVAQEPLPLEEPRKAG